MARRGSTVEKVTVTLPSDLIKELRGLAPAEGLSGFLAEAARQRLARIRLEQALDAGFGAWSADDRPELATSEATSNYVHALRREDDRS